MRYRPSEPPAVVASDSDAPPPAQRKVGPVVALIGAVAFGVTIAMVVAPRLATVVAPEAPDTSAPSPGVSAPPEAATDPTEETEPAAVQASATRDDDDPPDTAVEGVSVPEPPEGNSPEVRPVHVAASRSRRDRPHERRSPARRARSVGLQRVASGARSVDAPQVGDHDLGRARISEEPRPTRELDAAAVRRVIEPQRARMRSCYQGAVRRTGLPRDARMQIVVDVDPEGHVNDARVTGPDFGGLSHCLWRVAIRWSFPRSISGGRVPVPVAFSSRDE